MTGQEIMAKLIELGWQLEGEPYHAPDMGTYQNVTKDEKRLSILTRDPIKNVPYVYREAFIRSLDREMQIKLR